MLSKLENKLANNEFVVTAEIFPPKGVDISSLINKVNIIRDYVDAVNVTDCQRAVMRISALALSKILIDMDIEPVYQLTCRDRNRLALQSDILGAYVLGVRNILLISGDYPTFGDHADAKPVYDLDTIQLIKTVKLLEAGEDLAGKKLKGAPKFFIGGAFNPFSTPKEIALQTLKKKIDTGATFFQTQPIFDEKSFDTFLDDTKDIDAKMIVGIFLLKSFDQAKRISTIPGIYIPDEILKKLEDAKANDNELEVGIDIAAKLIRSFKDKVDGVHIMAIACEEYIPKILERI